jgi:hypothetical protein
VAKFALKAGAEIDLLSQAELREELVKYYAAREAARLRGLKWMRLPELLSGKAASGALALGESDGQLVGPNEGYVWSLRRLVVQGLTSGAVPDVVNLYRGTAAGSVLWQFNGNNFGYTFGRLELTLRGGERLALASSGTFAATGTVTLTGELIEAPAELIGKLA